MKGQPLSTKFIWLLCAIASLADGHGGASGFLQGQQAVYTAAEPPQGRRVGAGSPDAYNIAAGHPKEYQAIHTAPVLPDRHQAGYAKGPQAIPTAPEISDMHQEGFAEGPQAVHTAPSAPDKHQADYHGGDFGGHHGGHQRLHKSRLRDEAVVVPTPPYVPPVVATPFGVAPSEAGVVAAVTGLPSVASETNGIPSKAGATTPVAGASTGAPSEAGDTGAIPPEQGAPIPYPFSSLVEHAPIPPNPSQLGAASSPPFPIAGATNNTALGVAGESITGTTTISSTRYITIFGPPPSPTESDTTTTSTLFVTGTKTVIHTVYVAAEPSEAPGAPEGPPEGSPETAAPPPPLGGVGAFTCPVPSTITVSQTFTVTVTAELGAMSQAPVTGEEPAAEEPTTTRTLFSTKVIVMTVEPGEAAAEKPPKTVEQFSTNVIYVTADEEPTGVFVSQIADGQVQIPAPAPLTNDATSAQADATGIPAYTHALLEPPMASASLVLPPHRVPVAEKVAADAATPQTSAAAGVSMVPIQTYSKRNTAIGTSSTAASGLIPNGIKAGIAGFPGITARKDWDLFTPYIGWYTDYWPNTTDSEGVKGIPMLWGNGHLGDQNADSDSARLTEFLSLYPTATPVSTPPNYMLGFYEPDWTPPDSSSIEVAQAAQDWKTYLAPLAAAGTKMGSPSMAKQKDEAGWLKTFASDAGLLDANNVPTWDYTVIHTNKPTWQGVVNDTDYYYSTYKKPILVGEFACVDDQTWTPCKDPDVIKAFIEGAVKFFEGDERIVGYGYSNGNGLGGDWGLLNGEDVTAAGEVYLGVLKGLRGGV